MKKKLIHFLAAALAVLAIGILARFKDEPVEERVRAVNFDSATSAPLPIVASKLFPDDAGKDVERKVEAEASASSVLVVNSTGKGTTVYLSFGADSSMKATSFRSFCTVTSPLNCNFLLAAGASQKFPAVANYLNVTISFGSQGCGATKAELNMTNPNWFDTYDVSLVDGYSNKISVLVDEAKIKTALGPPLGKTGNEKVFGLYPFGCDICVARQNPPCGIPVGNTGCKAGKQYAPSVPCQFQGAKKGGGGAAVTVTLQP